MGKRIIANDTETTGFYIMKGHKPFLFINAERSGDGAIQTTLTKDKEEVRQILEDESIVKVFHNLKFDKMMYKSVGIDVKGECHCTMIMKHLLDSSTHMSLDYCAQVFLNEKKLGDTVDAWFKANKIKKEDKNYAMVPDEIMLPYARQDAVLTLKLFEKFYPAIIKKNLLDLYNQEIRLVDVLIDMYVEGILINPNKYIQLRSKYQSNLKKLETEIFTSLGQIFDIESPKQLAKILTAAGVNLPMTEKGNVSASKESLEATDHPIVEKIIAFRKDAKFLSTFVEALLRERDKHNRVHPNFNQTGTISGRFSSDKPNFQNLPKEDTSIREGVVPPEDYVLVSIDYDQMEYRIFMDYAADEVVIAKINSGIDYHDLVFSMVPELSSRKRTKTFNFLLIYGGGIKALTKKLKFKEQEAYAVKNKYFESFPSAKKFMDKVTVVIKDRGYIFNKFGRIVRTRREERYKAINYLVQGVCADICKKAMNLCHEYLKGKNSKLVIQVHDELVFYVHKTEYNIIPKLVDLMSEAARGKFKVILTAEASYSFESWGQLHEYKGEIVDYRIKSAE